MILYIKIFRFIDAATRNYYYESTTGCDAIFKEYEKNTSGEHLMLTAGDSLEGANVFPVCGIFVVKGKHADFQHETV